MLRQHQLGELLVQRERQDVGVRAGVGHPQLVEQRRVEGLAEAPAPPLGGVEDEVGPEGLEARHGPRGRSGDLDPLHPVAEPLEGAGQRVDGLAGVELGLVLGVGEAEVVGEGDAHGRLRARRRAGTAGGPAGAGRGARRRGGRRGQRLDLVALGQHLGVHHLRVGEDVADPDPQPVGDRSCRPRRRRWARRPRAAPATASGTDAEDRHQREGRRCAAATRGSRPGARRGITTTRTPKSRFPTDWPLMSPSATSR